MKRIFTILCALALVMAGSATALAAEPTEGGQSASYYPISVEEYTYGDFDELRINKTYQLSLSDDPSLIPTGDFTRNGRHYYLLDMTRKDEVGVDIQTHTETVTQASDTNSLETILQRLDAEMEVTTEDGYVGVLRLDHTSVQVTTDGYATKTSTLSASRSYPNLSEADVSLIPKSIEDKGKTLTLGDVKWSDQAYFFNLCIMNSALFNRYCEWLFPILSELEQIIDIENYTAEGQRTIGHLAERLLGIYILYLRQNVRDIRIKELQPVLFRNTKKSVPSLRPAFNKELEDKIVPIVLSSSNVFAPACAVAIQSILYNASVEKFYDIVILESDISDKNKKLILSMVDGTDNISIRFIDVTPIIKNYTLVASEHLTVETYYRFLIQEILPEYGKILYLDGDLVCNRDVSELFCVDIEGYMLAAAYDPDVGGQINLKNSDTLSYLVHELKMEDPSSYFQAGVLLLNLKEMRSAYSLEQWLTFAGKRYRYCDQDVLNRYCQGRVKYIDMAWNVMIDCENRRVPVVIHEAKGEIYRQYHEARKHPYIVHFAGFQKPWKQRGVDFEEEFWKYARNTPYYEQFLFNITIPPAMPDNGLPAIGVKGALKIYIKKKTDIWFPKGTKRRTVIKRIFGRFVKN